MSQDYGPSPAPTSRTRAGLLAVWAAMSLAALGFGLRFGHDLPWNDEWEFVPALTGHEPVGPWLWQQHNEHRLPLPRALYLGLYRLAGDFRTGIVAQVVILSGLSLGLMRAAAVARGRPAWADACLPVGLLHWGHAENFLMGYQINFALVCGFACGLVVVANRTTATNRFRTGLTAGGLLLLLELCGGTGLAFVPPVALWLLVLAAGEARTNRLRAAVLVGIVVVAVAYVAVYFVGYERPPGHPAVSFDHPGRAARVTLQFLAMGLGYGVAGGWMLAALWVMSLLVGTVGYWLQAWWADRSARLAAEGTLAVLGGAVGLAVLVGVGRSGFANPDMGLWSRYGLLAWPVLFAGYLTFAGRWPAAVFAVVIFALLPINTVVGFQRGIAHDEWLSAQEADILAGVTAAEVVERHLVGSGQEERASRGLPMLGGAP